MLLFFLVRPRLYFGSNRAPLGPLGRLLGTFRSFWASLGSLLGLFWVSFELLGARLGAFLEGDRSRTTSWSLLGHFSGPKSDPEIAFV